MESVKRTAFLSLGSNLGDRISNLKSAIESLKSIGSITQVSSVFESEPLNMVAESKFLNLCLALDIRITADILLIETQRIELSLGRVQKNTITYESRTIDIDILFIENLKINSDKLKIPHPEFHNRKFVLVPLNEIVPNFIDPNSNCTINSILDKCSDTSIPWVHSENVHLHE